MSEHECDGADCCEKLNYTKTTTDRCEVTKTTPTGERVRLTSKGRLREDQADVGAFLNSEIDLEEFGKRCHRRSFEVRVEERLGFLETRRVELQEMCELRTKELIAAKERIAHLERCLGRLLAEREER